MATPVITRYAEREGRIWLKQWTSWAFSFLVTPLLFLGTMGLGLGSYVDANTSTIAGMDYLTFVAPGLLAGAAMQNIAGVSMWEVMGGHKWQGQFNGAVSTPLRPADVYGGWLMWHGALNALAAVSFVTTAALLGGVPSAWGVLAVPFAVLGALSLAAPIAAWSITRETDASFPVVIRVVVMPMFVFAGTFFPVDQLPAAVQPLAKATPLWHAVELCRGATTGTLGLADALVHISYLTAFIAVGSWFAVRGFTRRLSS